MSSADSNGQDEVLKSLRLAADVADAAEQYAQKRGLTFSDVVEAGLRQQIGWRPNPMFELVEAIAKDLRRRFPTKRGFPPDVTLDVFHRVKANRRTWNLYQAAIAGPDGSTSDVARDSVHRRVGKTVKAVLDAEVVGRSADLGSESLIKTHALLAPRRRTAKKEPR
jgi:hypothetical protein